MANNDKAFGLRPLGNLAGTGAQKQYGYEIADNQAGAIFQGDLVVLKDGYILMNQIIGIIFRRNANANPRT